MRRASILALLAVLFLGTGLVLIVHRSHEAMIQPLPNGIVPHKPSFIHRWIPPTWGWFWRLKEAVLGRSKMITLNTTVISMFSTPGLAEPQFADTNQFQAWILANSELDALRRRLEQTPGNKLLSRPRAALGDRVQATLNAGDFRAEFLPRIHSKVTDLCVGISQTRPAGGWPPFVIGQLTRSNVLSMETNFAIAARFQIPNGKGVFMLATPHDLSDGNQIGVIISVELPKAKK